MTLTLSPRGLGAVARVVLVVAVGGLSACGRTSPSSLTDAAVLLDGPGRKPEVRVDRDARRPSELRPPPIPDGWRPPFDGWKPPFDSWKPPLGDGWPKPDVKPKADLWPKGDLPVKPDLYPKGDVLPPPVDGPCAGNCAQICQLASPCGYPGGMGKCVSDCTGWSPTLLTCLKNVVCSAKPSCALAASCLAPPPQLPDLVVTGFTATVTGTTVEYTVTVCNQGPGPASGFFVDVYYNRPTPPAVQQYGEQYTQHTAPLAPGACLTDKLSRLAAPGGTYTSWAQVDADGLVTESSETNNVQGPIKVTVGGPPPTGVDLVVTTMTAAVSGAASATVTYQLTVCNQGAVAAPATQVHVYYSLAAPPTSGQLGDQLSAVPALQPGACVPRSIVRSGVPNGSYASYAQVDPANAIAESNEANNVFGPVNVVVGSTPGADLTFNSFTATIQGPSTVRYTFQVCNSGTGNAAASQVHVYYNRGTAPGVGEFGDQYTNLPTLAPAACTTQNLFRSGAPAGSYTSWAQVDPTNVIPETNEANNVTGPLAVQVTGPAQQADLTVQQFTATAAGTDITYTYNVCNNGTVAAGAFRVDLYYSRLTPPAPSTLGDVFDQIPALAAGSCTAIKHLAAGMKVGIYESWVLADTTNLVSESSENNNTAGPRFVTVGTVIGCPAICAFATVCGVFTVGQAAQCTQWCSGLGTTARQCVAAATQSASCTAFKACPTPPPPPPPPPPGVCADLCSYLTAPCNLLPAGQYWTCVGACQNQPPSKIQCAQTARNQGQCIAIVTCLL